MLLERLAQARAVLRPPPKLNLWQWADEYRYLSPEAAAKPGKWRTSHVEVARGPMEAITDPSVHIVTVMCCTQLMKALALDTAIPTPAGWTTMGGLQSGDTVLDENGRPCRVTGVSEVKRSAACYRVTFSDGASIIADAGHQWRVDDQPRQYANRTVRVINTEEMAATFRANGRNRYAIPAAKPLDLPAADLPIDPYVLGVWLGDGHSYSTRVTVHVSDWEIVEHLEACGMRSEIKAETATGVREVWIGYPADPAVCRRGHDMRDLGRTKRGHCAECARQDSKLHRYGTKRDDRRPDMESLHTRLINLGLMRGSNSTNEGNHKHIPPAYLRASVGQRLALLQGLMDTDGTISAAGRASFTSTSRALVEGVAELIVSLGMKAPIKSSTSSYVRRDGVASEVNVITLTAYADMPIFRLRRKLERQPTRDGRRVTETERRRIVDVTAVETVPVKCIMVDSPNHLYLAGRDMVPTHNTELILNTIGYYVHQDPAPMIVMQPTVHMAEAFSKDRVDTMFRDSPALASVLPAKKSRDGGNTILHKQFPGGHLTMVGANAPGDLAMRPVRIVLCDEVDKYPGSAGDEGDPITIIGERSATFWNWKQIRTCSPTIDGRSRIALSYEDSDQRVFEPACPHCGHRGEMLWANVKWPEESPEDAAYHCPACSEPWTEAQRRRALRDARNLPGYGWTATKPFNGHAGFKVSKLASPWESLGKLARKFVSAKKSPELLKAFVNTQLAETWKEKGEAPDWKRLYNRREEYALNVVPTGGLLLFAGVDVQRGSNGNGWLEVVIYAEGRNRRRWVIDHRQYQGDTSDDTSPDSPWRKIDEMLEEVWPHEQTGVCMQLAGLAVDSGDQTAVVYRWAQRHSMSRVRVVKGDNLSVMVSAAKAVQSDRNGKKSQRGVKLFMVGQNLIKAELYADLRRELPGPDEPMPPGYVHFPQLSDEFFQQLTGEQMIWKVVKGRSVATWEPTRLRVEVLDCTVYARAAAWLHGVDRYREEQWAAIEHSLGLDAVPAKDDPDVKTETSSAPTGRERVKSSFWGSRR